MQPKPAHSVGFRMSCGPSCANLFSASPAGERTSASAYTARPSTSRPVYRPETMDLPCVRSRVGPWKDANGSGQLWPVYWLNQLAEPIGGTVSSSSHQLHGTFVERKSSASAFRACTMRASLKRIPALNFERSQMARVEKRVSGFVNLYCGRQRKTSLPSQPASLGAASGGWKTRSTAASEGVLEPASHCLTSAGETSKNSPAACAPSSVHLCRTRDCR